MTTTPRDSHNSSDRQSQRGLAAAALLAILASQTTAAPLYTLSALIDPVYPGAATSGVDINDHGVVVADTHLSGPGDGWFLWKNGVAEEPYWYDGYHHTPLKINNVGQVTGYNATAGSSDGWLWTNGAYQRLEDIPGGLYFSRPFALGDAGEAYGLSYGEPRHTVVPVSWDERGGVHELGVSFAGFHFYRPNDVNSKGSIVGWAEGDDAQGTKAWLWKNGNASLLPDPPSVTSQASFAYSVNEAGQIAGDFSDGITGFAIVWAGESVELLDNLPNGNGGALDINDLGSVVGIAWEEDIQNAAIWYPDSSVAKLADLSANADGWVLEEATAINNRGDIVGNGIDPAGIRRGFVLTRIVPEPASYLLVVVATLATSVARWWRGLSGRLPGGHVWRSPAS